MANFFRNKVLKEVGQTPETLLEFGPTVRGTVIGMSLANLTQGNILVSVTIEDDTGTEGFYFKDVVVPPNTSLRAVNGGEKLIVAPDNVLKIRSSQPDSLDVVMSYVEIQ
jgi:hypothetical protein